MNTLTEETATRALKVLAEAYAREVCGVNAEVTITKKRPTTAATVDGQG